MNQITDPAELAYLNRQLAAGLALYLKQGRKESPMFGKTKPAPVNRRPEATEAFKRELDKAINDARHAHVDGRMLATLLDQRADALRLQYALTAPVV